MMIMIMIFMYSTSFTEHLVIIILYAHSSEENYINGQTDGNFTCMNPKTYLIFINWEW